MQITWNRLEPLFRPCVDTKDPPATSVSSISIRPHDRAAGYHEASSLPPGSLPESIQRNRNYPPDHNDHNDGNDRNDLNDHNDCNHHHNHHHHNDQNDHNARHVSDATIGNSFPRATREEVISKFARTSDIWNSTTYRVLLSPYSLKHGLEGKRRHLNIT